jgi:hypothetical protein
MNALCGFKISDCGTYASHCWPTTVLEWEPGSTSKNSEYLTAVDFTEVDALCVFIPTVRCTTMSPDSFKDIWR